MNCPQCEQMIAPDSYRIGPWKDDVDVQTLAIVGCHRTIILRCTCCGYFQCDQDTRGFIRRPIHHYHNAHDIRRLDRQLARRECLKSQAGLPAEVAA